MNDPKEKTRAAADEMDRVDWGYDPDDDVVSPLMKTAQFFSEIPWNGDDLEMDQGDMQDEEDFKNRP